MPPKASKADVAKKQKVVEDKTFGLKNKNKSKSVQKYVQQIKSSVQPKVDPTKAKKKKEEDKAKEKELNDLFKVAVSQPKVPPGVDPKSIVCEFFKAGQCTKGFKCKFSHDLNVQRKGEKIDIYSDKRDDETMEEWDQEMLEKVVESKKNEYNNQNKATEIVCKFFLEAVEKKQYGWFWVCPNGNKECHYRHALPPGYVLKSQMKALLEEESEKIAIEDEIENQRSKVTTCTPMTTELFMQWRNKKTEEKEAGLAAQRADRAKNDRMSGRELFLADASLFVDDAEAHEKYHRQEEPEASAEKIKGNSAAVGPSSSTTAAGSEEVLVDDEDEDDDDELDLDELNELEASLSRTSIQIRELGIEAS
ncbi:PREDICTED: zinc finger CCCH domain-containing protein 11-like [Fragaria vesca subsp. vesca]|uniref:zinc finger CCCH domain-containing protein 11-like n=1 Tax=Fragaria vesca subsp. vesca TaxID=101020 RepID=UPI0002C3569F|nr:PREDICTED: zinc finger CCCH domain-containing protein 11-like [Fragaria vesca subsp. vesca]